MQYMDKKNNSSKTAINKVIEFLNFCLELYKKAISLYYSKKYAGLNDIICMKKTINGYKNELLNISLDSDIETISFTSEEITRIGFYSTDIAELAMDMILSSSNEMDL